MMNTCLKCDKENAAAVCDCGIFGAYVDLEKCKKKAIRSIVCFVKNLAFTL